MTTQIGSLTYCGGCQGLVPIVEGRACEGCEWRFCNNCCFKNIWTCHNCSTKLDKKIGKLNDLAQNIQNIQNIPLTLGKEKLNQLNVDISKYVQEKVEEMEQIKKDKKNKLSMCVNNIFDYMLLENRIDLIAHFENVLYEHGTRSTDGLFIFKNEFNAEKLVQDLEHFAFEIIYSI